MDKQEVIDRICSLRLPESQYVVVGGASLAVRGLRQTDDIDLVVTPELFEHLSKTGFSYKSRPDGKPGLRRECFEVYLEVNTQAFGRSTGWLIEHAEPIQGIPCVDLETLIGWKRTYGRAKDLRDVGMLEALESGRGKDSEAAA